MGEKPEATKKDQAAERRPRGFPPQYQWLLQGAVGHSYFVLNYLHKLKTRLNLNHLEPLFSVSYTQLSEEKDKWQKPKRIIDIYL